MSLGFSGAALAAVAIAASAASAGLAAYQASQAASAQKAENNYRAQVAANNATIALQQRSTALQQADEEVANSMRQRAQFIGKQRAALAANGVALGEGSATDILASTDFLGQAEVASIQNNAAREAWGYDVQGVNYRAESGLSLYKARQANPTKAALLAGAGSLLGSASSYASSKAGS